MLRLVEAYLIDSLILKVQADILLKKPGRTNLRLLFC